MILDFFLAIAPFILLIVLLLGFKAKAATSMAITLLVTVLLSLFEWKVFTSALLGASFASFFVFIELFLIILMAVFFVKLYEKTGLIDTVQNILGSISVDKRVQALLIGFGFVSVMEGAAGFGTPVALAAPFLVLLGFKPMRAIMIGLIGDSVSVVFGAAGTPIIGGLASLNLSSAQVFQIGLQTALINSVLAFLVTFAIVWLTQKKDFVSFIPFSLFSALAFVIPFILTAYFIGPELPSIVGGLVCIFAITLAAKYNFLMPKASKANLDLLKNNSSLQSYSAKDVIKAVFPFLVLITTLALSRNWTIISDFLVNFSIGFSKFNGLDISQSISPFYTPSFFFLIAIICVAIITKISKGTFIDAFSESLSKIKGPLFALFFVLMFARILLVTDMNNSGFQGVPSVIASVLASTFGSYFSFVSPLIGAFGAFVTGSATVSNILFAGIQSQVGGANFAFVTLQVVGASFGNMIALHNILAACAAVGVKDKEIEILKVTSLVALICLLIGGGIGFAFL